MEAIDLTFPVFHFREYNTCGIDQQYRIYHRLVKQQFHVILSQIKNNFFYINYGYV
jgi:hypothetical protein